jgi:condensin-2 complex subunit G2
MLVKLYEPILWRNLNVANPVVRRNAASLLMEAFPLQDPDARQLETDALLQKQFTALEVTILYTLTLLIISHYCMMNQ